MKSVIIKGTNGQKLFHVRKNKKSEYIADILTELNDKVEVTIISDDNKRIKLYPVKKI